MKKILPILTLLLSAIAYGVPPSEISPFFGAVPRSFSLTYKAEVKSPRKELAGSHDGRISFDLTNQTYCLEHKKVLKSKPKLTSINTWNWDGKTFKRCEVEEYESPEMGTVANSIMYIDGNGAPIIYPGLENIWLETYGADTFADRIKEAAQNGSLSVKNGDTGMTVKIGDAYEITVDKNSRLPVKILCYGDEGVFRTLVFRDFAAVGPYKVPMSVEITGPDNSWSVSYKIDRDSVALNEPVVCFMEIPEGTIIKDSVNGISYISTNAGELAKKEDAIVDILTENLKNAQTQKEQIQNN